MVKGRSLLVVAGAVWLAAGINVVRLGIGAICEGALPPLPLVIGIIVIYLAFHAMFSKMVGKHSTRIRGYHDEKQPFWRFFDAKGYVFLIVMMGGGIGLRMAGFIPSWFVAFFYTGLGIALALAGIGFFIHRARYGGEITCPMTKKTIPA